MQIELVVCDECEIEEQEFNVAQVPLQSILKEGYLVTECEKKHITVLVSRSQRYEEHFYFAGSSLINHNYRDAITTAASGYDGFIEFAIRIMLAFKGFDLDDLGKAMKENKLSERRLGGFYFLYLSLTGKPPSVLRPKEIELRNKVVHSTYIPSFDESREFIFISYKNLFKNLIQLNYINPIEETISSQTMMAAEESFHKKYPGCGVQFVDLYKYTNLRELVNCNIEKRFKKMLKDIEQLNHLKINKYLA